MLGDVVLAGQEGANAPQLQNALASVQYRKLINVHEGLAQLLIIERVGGLTAPAFTGVVVE